jgi:hypothetical protein
MSSNNNKYKIELVGNFPPNIGEFSHYWKYDEDVKNYQHQMVKIEGGEDKWVVCRCSFVEPCPENYVSVHGKIIELGTMINNL